MIFNKKYNTIFLDIDSPVMEIDEKINIILSPSLYWVKKLTLLVKYVRDVKKLLPSIFEDYLPKGNYNYSAYKNEKVGADDSDFFVFAYEDQKIIQLLAQKNISMNNVASIRFAQSEIYDFENAYKIDENKSICIKDEIVVLLPSNLLQDRQELDLQSLSLSKHKITLQQFSHIVDTKSIFKIASVLIIFIFLILSEYFITSQKTKDITKLKDELFIQNNLKSTMFQNKAMLKKYRTLNKKQIKIRKYTAQILSIKLQKDEKLSLLVVKDKLLSAKFSGVKKGHDNFIETKLKSVLNKNVKMKKTYKNEILRLEISL
ncbi:MAG: hypothetical protein COB17_08445 [Sulfurimonas sp.]|nr:MAG: hypothetical protein COB17_08445 [Sulfurimonas sp.]